MSALAALVLVQVATGGFGDSVGTPDSSAFVTMLLNPGPNEVPIKPCKDDCTRGSIVHFERHGSAYHYRIDVTATRRDEVTDLPSVAGQCEDMRDCVTSARAGLEAVVASYSGANQ